MLQDKLWDLGSLTFTASAALAHPDVVDLTSVQDLGQGDKQLYIHAHITTAFAGTTPTATASIILDSASSLSDSPITVFRSAAFTTELTLNSHFYFPISPMSNAYGGLGRRYVGLVWAIGGTGLTGACTAGIALANGTEIKHYASPQHTFS